jgi:hypothetical protein
MDGLSCFRILLFSVFITLKMYFIKYNESNDINDFLKVIYVYIKVIKSKLFNLNVIIKILPKLKTVIENLDI